MQRTVLLILICSMIRYFQRSPYDVIVKHISIGTSYSLFLISMISSHFHDRLRPIRPNIETAATYGSMECHHSRFVVIKWIIMAKMS